MHLRYGLSISFFLVWSILFIVILDIFNQLSFYFLQARYFSALINVFSWTTLMFAAYWIVLKPKKFAILTIFIILIAVKFAFYALVFHQFQFQKGIVLVPLLIAVVFHNDNVRQLASSIMNKYKYLLLILFLLTMIPFIDLWRYSASNYRFSAIWALPQSIAYYFVALMFLVGKYNLFVNMIFLFLIALTGARSGIIPAFIYLFYNFVASVKTNLSMVKRITFSTVFGVALLCILFFAPGFGFLREGLHHNLRPIFEESITNPGYGKGRVGLNVQLLRELKNFNVVEIIVGKSASSMYDFYVSAVGTRTWPHNDFVTALYIYGIVGLLIYIYFLFILPLRVIPKNGLMRMIILEIVVFIFAFTNGFYTYFSSFFFVLIYGMVYEESRRTCSNV